MIKKILEIIAKLESFLKKEQTKRAYKKLRETIKKVGKNG